MSDLGIVSALGQSAIFQAGDSIRISARSPIGHYRMPRYLRGKAGTVEAVIRTWQYLHGSDPDRVSPDGYTLDIAYMARTGAEEIQLDLILDYRSNVALCPEFQAHFRKWKHHSSPRGGRMTLISFQPELMPTDAIFRRLRYICSIRAISPSKPTPR